MSTTKTNAPAPLSPDEANRCRKRARLLLAYKRAEDLAVDYATSLEVVEGEAFTNTHFSAAELRQDALGLAWQARQAADLLRQEASLHVSLLAGELDEAGVMAETLLEQLGDPEADRAEFGIK